MLDAHRGGSGEPLVLIHGIGSTWRMWKPVLPLLERDHDVLAVDLPGFGKSPPLPEGTPPTPDALADAVEREMDAAGWETAHIAGNSLGGRIAAELARRGRARTAVLSSPAGLGTDREKRYAEMQLKLTIGAARRIPAKAARLPGAPFTASVMYGRPWRVDGAWLQEQLECLAGSADFEGTMELLHEGQPQGLEEIDAPTLVAWGKRDRLLPPRQAERWRVIPGAEVRYLPGCGHVPTADDPELIAETIRSWSTGRRAAAPA